MHFYNVPVMALIYIRPTNNTKVPTPLKKFAVRLLAPYLS